MQSAPEYLGRLTDAKELLSALQRQPGFMTEEQRAEAFRAAASAWAAAPVLEEPTVVSSEVELRNALASHAHRWIHIESSIMLSEVEQLNGKGLDGTVRPLRVDREHQDLKLTASEGVTIDASGCKDNGAAYGCALDVRGGCVTLEHLTLRTYGVWVAGPATVKAAHVAIDCSSDDAFAWALSGDCRVQLSGGRATGNTAMGMALVYAGSDGTHMTLSGVTIQGSGSHAVHASSSKVELEGCTIEGCWESPFFEEDGATITKTDCTIRAEPPPRLEGSGGGGGGSAKEKAPVKGKASVKGKAPVRGKDCE
jgi:hypothetical protein